MLSRVVRDGLTASALKVPIAAPSEAEIELTIDDGANEPLDLRAVSVVLAELPWIYFEAPAGAVTARYGNLTLPRPAYDLEAVRGSVDLAKLREAKWGDRRQRSHHQSSRRAGDACAERRTGRSIRRLFKYGRAVDYTLEGGQKGSGLVALAIDAHALAYSRGPSQRFADIRLLDGSNQQIPYLVERRNEPLSIDLPLTPGIGLAGRGFESTGRQPPALGLCRDAALRQPAAVDARRRDLGSRVSAHGPDRLRPSAGSPPPRSVLRRAGVPDVAACRRSDARPARSRSASIRCRKPKCCWLWTRGTTRRCR